jgi:hypothetical protein
MDVKEEFKIDLIPQAEPALSTRSDMPVVETKPDSHPAPEEKKPEAKADAAPDEGKTKEVPEESATPEEPADPAASDKPEGKPKSQGVQKRIDELVRQREEERAEKLRLLAIIEGQSKPKPEVKPEAEEDPAPQRPDRAAYTDPAAYESALADYADAKAAWSAKTAVREALAEEGRKRQEEAARQAQTAAQEAYNARVSKTAEKYADYKAVAESPDVQVSMPMAQAILQSEHGPDIQYYLGKNPAEAKRISSLHPLQQLVELGTIVAKLTATTSETPAPAAPATKPAPVSAAPKPIKPLESKSEPAAKDPSQMSMEEYAAYAKKRDADAAKRSGARR